ncbi:hypothetical protein J6590_085173, partial [Homalodisca vitripennis]
VTAGYLTRNITARTIPIENEPVLSRNTDVHDYERPRMPRRYRIPSNYQTRIRVRGQRHVFLGGWKFRDPTLRTAVPFLSDSSSDNSSSDDDLVLLYSDVWRVQQLHDLEADDDKFRTYFRVNKEQSDEVLDLIDQGDLCACASHRSFADVGQESLQSHIPADGGRRDEQLPPMCAPTLSDPNPYRSQTLKVPDLASCRYVVALLN